MKWIACCACVVFTCSACAPDGPTSSPSDGGPMKADESSRDGHAMRSDDEKGSAQADATGGQRDVARAEVDAEGRIDYVAVTNAICAEQCRAGCNLIETQPDACASSCYSLLLFSAFRLCQLETENYILCLRTGAPIFYCPGYGDASPCYPEAKVMVDCVNRTPS